MIQRTLLSPFGRGFAWWASLGLHGLVLGSLAFAHLLGAPPAGTPAAVALALRPPHLDPPDATLFVTPVEPPLELEEPEFTEPHLVEHVTLGPQRPDPTLLPLDFAFTLPGELPDLAPDEPEPEPLASEDIPTAASSAPPAPAPVVPAPPIVAAGKPRPLHTPPPGYPRASRRAGEQGEVRLALEIDPAGGVVAVRILRSSGHSRLDDEARTTLAGWRFEPTSTPAARTFEHTVTFRLAD